MSDYVEEYIDFRHEQLRQEIPLRETRARLLERASDQRKY